MAIATAEIIIQLNAVGTGVTAPKTTPNVKLQTQTKLAMALVTEESTIAKSVAGMVEIASSMGIHTAMSIVPKRWAMDYVIKK